MLISIVVPVASQAEFFSFGVKGGMPAQIPLEQTDNRMPFVVGPTIDLRLFRGVSIETGVMFQRLGEQPSNGVLLYPENSVTLSYGTQTAHALDIPILAKVHLLSRRGRWQPFVTLGPTVRRTTFETSSFVSILSGAQLVAVPPQPVLNLSTVDWRVDPTFGTGVDFRTGRFHLEPEVRYSYWGAGADHPVRKNQVDFLLGFRF